MKKLFFAVVLTLMAGACHRGQTGENRAVADTAMVAFAEPDSVAMRHVGVVHTTPDGLFDDFFYRFIQDSTLQMDRIAFPLSCLVDGQDVVIERPNWRFDSVYSSTAENAVVLDGKDVGESRPDSAATTVAVEVADLKAQRVKMYHFVRTDGHWVLHGIDEHGCSSDHKQDFFAFYSRFANDEAFQCEQVHDPFYFKTFDEDSFQEISGWVAADSWLEYRTFLPSDQLIHVVYNHSRPASNYRTLAVGSPSSGVYCTLLFKRTEHCWELVRLEN